MINATHALNLWIEITGVDPMATTIYSRDIDVVKMNDELKESVSYDPTQITTVILMKYFVNKYMEKRSFNVMSFLKEFDSFTTYLGKCKQLIDLLDTEEIAGIIIEFKEEMNEALSHYEVERPDVFSFAEDATKLAFIRRDALRSIETLTLHQFAQGVPDKDRPIMYKTVNQFWNIDALIQSACRMKSGISLNLIRDPKSDASYFVFAYRNGGTVGILTDKPYFTHPMQKHMSRTRAAGRDFMERIASHHFPYSLMDIIYGDNGRAYVKEQQNNLAIINKTSPMKEIKDLEPDEVIWAIMMFSLIEDKFFKQNYKTPQLSYTGSMIRSSSIMLEAAKENQLSVTNYLSLTAPYLTTNEVTTEKMLGDWEQTPTRKNEWIEKRYIHKISDVLLNTIDTDEKKIYLLPNQVIKESRFSVRIIPRLMEETTLKLSGEVMSSEISYQVVSLTDQELDQALDFCFDKDEFLKQTERIHSMASTTIGTANEIIADLRWTARYNLAKLLQVELNREYAERQLEITTWYNEAVQRNLPNLLKAIAEGQLVVPSVLEPRFASESIDKGGNILQLLESANYYGLQVPLHTWKNDAGSQFGCIIKDSQASFIALFRPHTSEALSIICGCSVEELPDILQHWTNMDQYHGNEILSRLDPMDWAIKNPWAKLNMTVGIYLSKTAYNELRKSHGLKPNKFWIKPKEKPDRNERQVFIKPKPGDKVEFHSWRHFGNQRIPDKPWIGVVEKVEREGRVNGLYQVKRNYDGQVVTIHGYQNLTIPKSEPPANVLPEPLDVLFGLNDFS
ncbi:hypothetical protein ACFYU8_18675 [Brevibacillus sp. NPDC003359]|uniref:hypothetical protein n=1 Tax=unclassified Brevibacillus TaxID=2684853 RepID=UPI00367D61F3